MQEGQLAQWSLQARIKEEPRKRPGLPPDIFAGTRHYEACLLKSGPVKRLRVVPEGFDSTPANSYAVLPEHVFESLAQFELPFSLRFQQSLPRRFDLEFELGEGVCCFGLGERYSDLNLRGTRHTLITTDNSKHDEAADSLYKSIPFLILYDSLKGLAWGLFVDTPAPQRFDLDSELDGIARVEIFSQRPWSIYFLGPAPLPEIVALYTELTGRAMLPPRWSLGHFQCRWSYGSQKIVRDIAAEIRKRKIPCDCIVLDIDYMEGYRVFTHSREHFPEFKKLIEELGHSQFKVVTIVDPGVKYEKNFSVFKEGSKRRLFCFNPAGDLYVDEVWPGLSVFPDFVREETRKWWGDLHRFYLENGVAGIWNDMNEPAFFRHKHLLPSDSKELPEPQRELMLHNLNGEAVGHLELRNVYGLLMSQATHEGLLSLRPEERPFVLSRSGYAGIQRHAAVWLGDNRSWWEHLRKTVPMLLNIGLSGLAFAGVDIGGFGDDTSPELLLRWYEQGIFYPFFRNHTMMGSRAQEPWAFSPDVEDKIRKLIQVRYSLLPYLQGLFWDHLKTGAPIMRPMVWHYPQDKHAASLSDQFMFGSDMLVAPITERGATRRVVYFPEGSWYPFGGMDEPVQGPAFQSVMLAPGSVPAWVRGGAIIPVASPMQSTAEYEDSPICFQVYGERARGYYIDDDGSSFGYLKADFGEWFLQFEDGRLSAEKTGGRIFNPARKFSVMTAAGEQKFSLC